MILPRKFNEFVKEGIVRKQSPDKFRANDLKLESERKFNSLNRILKSAGLDEENANDVVEFCYDIVLNLIRSEMLANGFNSSGIGAHEAEVSFMRELKFSENEIDFANQLRYFRNGIKYYGKRFNKEYALKVIDFMKRVREKLR